MANPLYYAALITDEQMNNGINYRVKFSYGTFTIASQIRDYVHRYYYAYKRVKGKLHKVYVGECGRITKDVLHQATMKLGRKIRSP